MSRNRKEEREDEREGGGEEGREGPSSFQLGNMVPQGTSGDDWRYFLLSQPGGLGA